MDVGGRTGEGVLDLDEFLEIVRSLWFHDNDNICSL